MTILATTTTSTTFTGSEWLASAAGTDSARSVTIDTSTLTEATHAPEGFIPAGLPLGLITDDDTYGLYVAGASDGRETCVGFVLEAVPFGSGTDLVHAAMIVDGGQINLSKLPTPGLDSAGQTDLAARFVFHA